MDKEDLKPLLDGMPEEVIRHLAWLARRAGWAHPRGGHPRFRSPWYPDPVFEGVAPNVKSPSCRYPYSYLDGCLSRQWMKTIPLVTAKEDALVWLRRVVEKGSLAGFSGKSKMPHPVKVALLPITTGFLVMRQT